MCHVSICENKGRRPSSDVEERIKEETLHTIEWKDASNGTKIDETMKRERMREREREQKRERDYERERMR